MKSALRQADVLLARKSFSEDRRVSHLSRRIYLLIVGGTGFAAMLQLFLLPLFLDPRAFGLVVISIASTQAVLQLSDLGITSVGQSLKIAASDRARLKESALAVSNATVAIASAGVIAAILEGPLAQDVGISILLGLLTGLAVTTDRLRAATRELAGDETGAARCHALWQNAPKLGMILAAPSGSPFLVMIGGLITGLALCRPLLPRGRALRDARRLKGWRVDAAGNTVAPYAMNWADSFAISATMGLASLGAYQLNYRIIAAVAYVAAPFASILVSRSRNDPRQALRTFATMLLVTLLATPALALGAHFYSSWVGFADVLDWKVYALLALGQVALVVSTGCGRVLISWGERATPAMASLAAAGVILIASSLLVPVLGVIGAALASAAGLMVAAIWQGTRWWLLLIARRIRSSPPGETMSHETIPT